ncbi:MAG TPA: HEAT repeat domain-containing protein [Acidimicrobiales bacterium]|nr:HEAT repeat domain-containing protein [Acidimicrobiales bacterium]
MRRRRDVVLAGHRGDEPMARQGLADDAADVRAAALGALLRMGRLSSADVAAGLADPSAVVRRRACEVATGMPLEVAAGVVTALRDEDGWVVEAACFALGEWGAVAGPSAVAALVQVATGHPDPLCREAAVAALGAISDPCGLAAILAATLDKPAVRRRAILALAPFAGPEVDAALHRALADRDWQVRQAAEDLLGNRDPASDQHP